MKIKELLSDETKWCQHYLALTEKGEEADVNEAARWCIIGAAMRCYPNYSARANCYIKILAVISSGRETSLRFLVGWQDDPDRKFSEIQAVLEEANV